MNYNPSRPIRQHLDHLAEHYGCSVTAVMNSLMVKGDPTFPITQYTKLIPTCHICDQWIKPGNEDKHGDVVKGSTATAEAAIECSSTDDSVPF